MHAFGMHGLQRIAYGDALRFVIEREKPMYTKAMIKLLTPISDSCTCSNGMGGVKVILA